MHFDVDNAAVAASWESAAGGPLNFSVQLGGFEFPGIQPGFIDALNCLTYHLVEIPNEVTYADQFAKEVRLDPQNFNAALKFWRNLGVIDWHDHGDGYREFALKKSPLDVRFQLVVQVDGKTVLNTTDVPTIEKLILKKGRGKVRGTDQAE